jgi:hypothetical protein
METEKQTEGQEIVTALAKENVTEALLARFKANYLPLKIKDINDKVGYEAVKLARKECKDTRVATVKICKKGREDAIKIQKAWIAKENEITSQIKPVEDHLSQQEDWFDTETAKAKLLVLRTQQLPLRKTELVKVGATVPPDEQILGMDDMSFLNYLNNERTRILNEKEAALNAKAKEQEAVKLNADKGLDSVGMPYVIQGGSPLPNGSVMTVSQQNKAGQWETQRVVVDKQMTDKEALTIFAERIYQMEFPQLKGEIAQKIVTDSKKILFNLAVDIVNKAETINS